MLTENKMKKVTLQKNKILATLFLAMLTLIASAQNNSTKTTKDDTALLDSFIQAQGYRNAIVFTPENIKQFWVDKTIASQNNLINIHLKEKKANYAESIPLKIQLANVDAMQDCKIDVISTMQDFEFYVLNNQLKTLASSSNEDDFIQYKVSSSVFHMEETDNLSFFLKFKSSNADLLSINRIVLSFSNNTDFVTSTGSFVLSKDNIETEAFIEPGESDSFIAKGKNFSIFSAKRIVLSDNAVICSVRIKNTGGTASRVYVGYAPYTKEGKRIDALNNLYKDKNTILKVVAFEKNSNKIVVDSYPDWEKKCVIALNAEEDCSDFPNHSFIDGKITEIEKNDNGQSIITLDKNISQTIEAGTSVRIQGPDAESFIYIGSKTLQPGEEVLFQKSLKLDNSLTKYCAKAFCKGTYYVRPVILIYNPADENIKTILISDYNVSF